MTQRTWDMRHDTWHMTHDMIHDTWYMIHDISYHYADSDARSMTLGRSARSYKLLSLPSSSGRSSFYTNCQVPTSSFGRFGRTRGRGKFWRRGRAGGERQVEGGEEGRGEGGGGGEDARGEEEQHHWVIWGTSAICNAIVNSSKCASPFQMASTHTLKDEYKQNAKQVRIYIFIEYVYWVHVTGHFYWNSAIPLGSEA